MWTEKNYVSKGPVMGRSLQQLEMWRGPLWLAHRECWLTESAGEAKEVGGGQILYCLVRDSGL